MLANTFTADQTAFLLDVPSRPLTDADAELMHAEYLDDCRRNDEAAVAAVPADFYGVAPTMGSELCRVYSTRTGTVLYTLPFDEAVTVAGRLNSTVPTAA